MPGLPEIFPELHTQRLDLIEITTQHLQDLYHLFTNPQVTEFYQVIPLQEPGDAQKIVGMLSQRFKDKTGIRWGIAPKGESHLIGTIGYNTFTRGHRSTIAFALLPEYWGKGYITEAIAAIVQFGFDVLKVNRIEAEVLPGNMASEIVLRKNGFHHEGLLRQWMLWDDTYYDINMYALLKDDMNNK